MLLILVGAFLVMGAKSSNVLAAGNDDFFTEPVEGIVIKENMTAPVPKTEGKDKYIFAGYYAESECKTPVKASTDATVYAKFVPSSVLSVKAQLKADTTVESAYTNLRLVSSVDGLNYKNVGFEVYYNNATKPVVIKTTKVYERIIASAASGVDYHYSPKVVGVESEYFITATLLNINKTNFEKGFYIKPYWQTLDGTMVYGESKYFSVNNGLNSNNINIPVKVSAQLNVDSLSVTVGGTEYPASVAYYDSPYAYVNITVANRDNVLDSLSEVIVTDGTTTGTAEYRNLMTKYTGAGSEDTSWYDENTSKMLIATAADLYGLAEVAKTDTFAGKTVYVVADIEANKGTASSIEWTPAAEGGTSYPWTPIGKDSTNCFAGTFDGQGHTISGIYLDNTTGNVGMFGFMKNSVDGDVAIQNFRLENSYFASSERMMGSIVVAGHGIIRNVYSSANIVSTYSGSLANYDHIGGIMGYTSSYNVLLDNCWFDGTITTKDGNVGGLLGTGATNTIYNHCSSTGVINCTKTNASYVGGIIGKITKNMTATVRDSVYSGTINNSGCTTKSFVGLNDNGIIGAYDSYTTSGETSADWINGGSYAEDSTAKYITTANLSGYLALNTNLDFENYWAVRATKVPALKMFADAKVCDVDTSWYDANEEIFEISNAEELIGFSYLSQTNNFAGKTIKLVADIDLNTNAPLTQSGWDSYVQKNRVNEWIPIGTEAVPFAGTFDGQGYTISGLYINVGSVGCQGLFAFINGATVRDFELVNGFIKNSGATSGVIAGRSTDSTISDIYQNVYFENNSTSQGEWGSRVGGVIGQAEGTATIIRNCWIAGDICVAGAPVGGVVGKLANGGTCNISNVICTSDITSTCTAAAYAGGICGWRNNNGTLTISDSVFANTFHLASASSAGTLVGLKHWNGQITSTNVYVLNNSATVAGATTMLPTGGSGGTSYLATGVTDLTGSDVTGFQAFDSLSLAYGTTWTVRMDDVPTLLQFAEADALLDTRWYNENDKEFVIDTAAELYGLAFVSKTDNFAGKTVKLGADITVNKGTPNSLDAWNTYLIDADLTPWMVIGSSAKPFAGTFNGQGHTISGIYHNTTESYQGLFGVVNGATITDFRLENSYFTTSGTYIASIAGQVQNSTLTKLYSNAVVTQTATSSWSRSGGMFGQADTGTVTISECWFDGTFQTAGGRVGAVLGWGAAVQLNMSNCLNTGTLISSHSSTEEYTGGLIGGFNNNANTKGNISDCINAGILELNGSTSVVGTVFGHLSYNAGVTINNVYATSNKAIISGNETSIKTIYNAAVIDQGNGVTDYTGYNMNGEYGYSLTALDFEKYWGIVENKTPILKVFAEDTKKLAGVPRFDLTWYDSSKTSFSISSAEQLYGLSYLSTVGIDAFNGDTIKLSADIVLNGKAPERKEDWETYINENTLQWTPIGTEAVPFAGTFDGQGHTISGLYINVGSVGCQGLFAFINGATVRDFELVNGFIKNSGATSGVIAGRSTNSTISDIYQNVYFENNSTSQGEWGSRVGGVIGQAEGTATTIRNCWIAGDICVAGAPVGGIVGKLANGGTCNISNVICTSDITSTCTAAAYAGGICGWRNNNGTLTISDSVFANTFHLASTSSAGTLVGLKHWNGQITSTNVYVLNNSATVAGATTALPTGGSGGASYLATGVTDLTGTDIKGYKALDVMSLPFGTTWTIRENDIPTLTKFAGDAVIFDTSWYNDSDTEFVIDTAQELYGLAYISKTDNFAGKTVKLGADITDNADITKPTRQWVMTIGTSGMPFAGTFDGQGYTISGLYAKTTANYISLFGDVRNGAVGNFSVKNSYFESTGSHVSGAIAYAQNSTISDIYSSATVITTNTGEFARAAGILSQGDTGTVTISNCWFDGTVTSKGGYNGGIVGRASAVTMNILHCLNTGKVSSTFTGTNKYTGGVIGGINNANTSIISVTDTLSAGTLELTGSTACSGTAFGFIGYNANVTMSNVYATTNKAIISGAETTHVINVGSPDNGSIINLTDVSVIGKDALTNASGLDYDGYWMAVEGKTPVLKSFYAMAADTAWYDNAAEDATEYTISTANELYGLAKLSVMENFAGKTIYLANDIALNDKDSMKYQWVTPIGTENNAFAGTFDGTGKTISGIYINSLRGRQGLFGNLTGTIQNVRLEDGSITTSGSQSGTVAGTVTATGSIQNVYSNVDLVAKSASGYDHIGGFVGLATASADATLKIQNCWFDGNITAAGRGVGGFVGTASGAKITLNIAHCLNTGDVSSSYGSSRTGGICGQVLNSTVTITDTLNAGHLSFSTNEYQVGSVVGVVDQGVTNGTGNVTLSSVFTTRESYVKPTSQSLEGESYKGISGVFYQVTEKDRFVGYFSDYSDFVGTGNYATDRKLDFVNYWTLSKTGTPILQTFAAASDVYDIATADTELLLSTWNSAEVTVTNAKDFGNGVYQITVNDETGYTDYVAALKDAGFTCIENTMDGMYSATCSKGEWIVTVIHAAGTVNKTYISFSTGQSLSKNISSSAADTSVKAADAQNKLHMLQQEVDGNSMVIELKNGHFVVYDGGMAGELETLMSYMKKLAGTTDGKQNPVVIEAWIISHFHADHCGALGNIRNYPTNTDIQGWLTDVTVEAVYVNEPNDLVKDYEVLNQTIKTVTDVYNGIRFLKDTKGNIPTVYRMQAGQRYYFGDITMDVVLSQELMTSIEMYTEDFGDVQSIDFNDTSTWIMFNVDGEKVLLAADGNKVNMDYIIDVYSQEYLTVDVFQAPHHASNTYETFTNYCTVNDYVLFDGIYNPTSYTNWTGGANEEGAKNYSHLVINENRKLVGLSPIITDTSELVIKGYAGKLYEYDTTPAIPYFYMNGKHTILTFTGTGISGAQVEI